MAKERKTTSTALVRAKRPVPAKARPAKPRPSTAIVKRDAGNLARLTSEFQRIITKDPDIGLLGMVEVKLTQREIDVLYAPVEVEEVDILPSGAIYLPHTYYTELFNRAFGPGGWGIVQVATPQTGGGNTIVAAYVLTVHGKPWAFAWGEHDYHEKNRNQTYGDAVEATVASAMRRCAKRRGITMELWKRSFVRAFQREHAVRVTVTVDGQTKQQWRRKDAPPLPGERGRTRRDDTIDAEAVRESLREEDGAGSPAHTGEFITTEQQARLARAIGRSGRPQAEVSTWLERQFNVKKSLGEIRQADYSFIVRMIESPGTLPATKKGDR